MICTDKTDSSKVLFFPAVGFLSYEGVYDMGNYGAYWSSTVQASCGNDNAFHISFHNDNSVSWDEVTLEQWAAVMDSNPTKHKDPKRPVASVSWDDCTPRYNGYSVRGILD